MKLKRITAFLLAFSLCIGFCVTASAAGGYTSVYDIPDEEYLREDFHSVNDYGHLIGYTGEHYSQQSATFPDDLVAVLPESSYVPYKYPSKSITRLELPKSLVILDGSFESYTTGGYSNLHEVNFEELTNLKYIGGWFQNTPLYSIDLRNTQVVRIATEGTFSNNRQLQAFYASPTLRRIDYGVFHDCRNLSYIELNEGLEYIGGHNFGSNSMILALDVDDSVKRYITIPSTVTYIGEGGLPTYYKVWADSGATTMRTISARYLVYRGSYGEQWCKENKVQYAYVTDYRGNVLTRPYNPKEELPKIDEWAQFGDLTFSGDGTVSKAAYIDTEGNEVITGYYVRLAPGAYIQTVADGDSIVYDYNGSKDYERDSSMPDKLIDEDIRPYVTEAYGNGYKKGLTWRLEGSYSRHYSVAGIYDIYVDRANGERSPKYHITLTSWAGVQFTDVNDSDYFGSPVLWAIDMGITDGTSDTTFSPNSTCTNAQILTFLWRAQNCPEPLLDSTFAKHPFTELTGSEYYYKAAIWAYQKGLISGDAFDANTPCTRSMTVTYLWKLAGKPTAEAADFTDVDTSAEYAQAVAWAVAKGITDGTSDTTFSPNSTCTRGQIVTFLWRNFTY